MFCGDDLDGEGILGNLPEFDPQTHEETRTR